MPKISVLTPTIRTNGLAKVHESLKNQTFQDFEWLVEAGFPHRGNDLNQAYNRLIKRAQGELIVSWQDFIYTDEFHLQKCWDAYQEHPDTFFTCPVGKLKEDGVKWDWRNTDHPMDWRMWEIDMGFVPKKLLYDVGGFDETLDRNTWSGDNVVVGFKAQQKGYKFGNLKTAPCYAVDHDALMPHPFRSKYRPLFFNDRIEQIRDGAVSDFLS